ncbi:MAG: hypothetical protein AAGC85_14620 [Bacteroidota bacterium]
MRPSILEKQIDNINHQSLTWLLKPIFSLFLLLSLSFLSSQIHAQTPFRILVDTPVIILDHELFIMEEPDGGIDMNNPIQPESFSRFDSTFIFTSGKSYWGYIYLNQQLDFGVQWLFTPKWPLDESPHDLVDVYFRYADSVLQRSSGLSLPKSERDIAEGPGNMVHFYLYPGQGVEIFFRVENEDGRDPSFSPTLVEAQHWKTYYREVAPSWIGTLLGILIPFLLGLGGWFVFQRRKG